MQRVYFVCPNTRKQFSVTLDIPGEQTFTGMADVQCRQCGEIHRVLAKDVVKSVLVGVRR